MSNPVPLELQSKIQSWRLRASEGSLTLEDMKEAVRYLRAGRVAAASAASAGSKKRSAAIAAIPSASSMLDDLDAL